MELTAEQKKIVSGWVTEGCSLADIQKNISEKFGVSMTYMEVRFLIDDIGAMLKDKETRPRRGADLNMVSDQAGSGRKKAAATLGESLPDSSTSGVSIDVDRVTKPGTVASGTVTFSDGVKGNWVIDPLGRLALSADKEGYKPSAEDIREFQEELAGELQKKGF